MQSIGRAVVAIAFAAISAAGMHAQTIESLRNSFLHPPAEARPMVRWWWFGVAVTKPEIQRELTQMKADGIGGAELAFVYPEALDDPATGLKNLPFLSVEMLDAVRYAQSEGRRLGLRIDVTLCSGWPYGGPATTLAEAAGRLRIVEVPVPPNSNSAETPKLAEGEALISAALVEGTPNPAPRRGPPPATPPPSTWDPATSAPLQPTGASTSIAPSAKSRVAVFFISGHTGQQVKRAAVAAEGFVLDPFSAQAVATHLKAVGEPLLSAFGATPPYAIFSDSLEAYGADWTPNLPAEFRKRRGYDLVPHLPEIAAGGSPAAERVRHDWGKTLTELVNENYLTQINNWANAHHTRFRSQTYGEPAVSFSSQNLVALAEGEGPQWRAFSTLRWATSANHVFDHNVTSGETFTWLHSPVFRATPLDMKAEADIDFIMGENQLIFHGWPYSAPQAGEPGWSLYAAAVFNDHNPWRPVMPAVNDYIARMSFLLRQGKPANQVAILLPTDDAWAGFSPSRVSVTGAMQRLVPKEIISSILSAGYNFDFIDAEAVDRVGLGTHQLLVLPPTDRIPSSTARKLSAFIAAGGKVIAVGRLPSLDAEGAPLHNAATLMKSVLLLKDVAELEQSLHDSTPSDLRFKSSDPGASERIGFIRRKLANADVYVLVNTSNETVAFSSVSFATRFETVDPWDPQTGNGAKIGANCLVSQLAPYESRVFVISGRANASGRVGSDQLCPPAKPASTHKLDLSENWNLAFTGTGRSEKQSALRDWVSVPATRNYSGEVVYTRTFTLTGSPALADLQFIGGTTLRGSPNSAPEHAVLGANGLPNPLITRTGPGMRAFYDPPIREAALVYINGKAAGGLWHPPYTLDVKPFLKPGENRIEVRVYNTALNAWAALPPRDYKPLIAKYGDRFQMQDLDKVEAVPSGILGKVQLVLEGPSE